METQQDSSFPREASGTTAIGFCINVITTVKHYNKM